jgi:[protein-PII] uridylyltransferase
MAMSPDLAAPALRERIAGDRAAIVARFESGEPAHELVRELAQATDRALGERFATLDMQARVALVAVGGYGRGELHPASDIDLLLLTPEHPEEALLAELQGFVAELWDLGLDVGHSVRSVSECGALARGDITIATALMESRLLAGDAELFRRMRELAVGQRTWSSQDFFTAKLEEQRRRHARYDDTAYKLEPNVKESPGGLRDLQVVVWVAKHHFGAESLERLNQLGFLTDSEYTALLEGRNFLWQVRFALHVLADRREDRLLFEHQRAMAERFGFSDDDANLAVEQFMKQYYRTVVELSRLDEMLLELLQEAILVEPANLEAIPINRRFRSVAGFLEVRSARVFQRQPWSMLELFLLMQQHPELNGVRASTIRLVRDHRHRIDESVRADIRARSVFMEILRQPSGVTHELSRMHRYGVLDRYLPAFAAVAGQMQFDLFHVYTVDEHSLRVLGNLRAFAVEENAEEFPLLSRIFRGLPKPELLYIAGLFHDIAKGRGGDHSDLGADDTREFCEQHGLSPYDAGMASWLVRNHLLMSTTSQRQDISDPEVVARFARLVGDQVHLDYLYLLTVGDIRGTNPQLWNDWRASLLRALYGGASRALRDGLENTVDRDDVITRTQEQAKTVLMLLDPTLPERAAELWSTLGEDYVLRASADEIAWHAQALVDVTEEDLPVVLIRPGRGGTEVFVYAHDKPFLFACVCSLLDRAGLNILDARIITAENGMTLDTFVVLDLDGRQILAASDVEAVRQMLREGLADPAQSRTTPRRMVRRQLRAFKVTPRISAHRDPVSDRTVLEVFASDRPGLLANIGWALADSEARLQNAKIATLGERAEDVFFITDAQGRPLSPAHLERVKEAVRAAARA